MAAQLTFETIDHGHSMDAVLGTFVSNSHISNQDRAFVQELVYGVCRWFGELNFIAEQLLQKPIRRKERVIHFLLLVGLYQLRHLSTADHAAISETVSACEYLNKQWAKKLLNGCLRSYQRRANEDQFTNQAKLQSLMHPQWLRDAINTDWPEHLDSIIKANLGRPPMCIRVNAQQYHRDDYLSLLTSKDIKANKDDYSVDGIVLDKPIAVDKLPGFYEGACSVQDTAAQLAKNLLQLEDNLIILDACAAPGGKAAHVLESDYTLTLDALEISATRCEQLHATMNRLGLNANIMCGDATMTTGWDIPKQGYDRIIIDAPCSGVGVIRRHPDILHHRRASDINELNRTQDQLLNNLWPLLKPNGFMLYMTCSILKCENEQRIENFLQAHTGAAPQTISHPNAFAQKYGLQTLPGVHSMDGFYYCLIAKHA